MGEPKHCPICERPWRCCDDPKCKARLCRDCQEEAQRAVRPSPRDRQQKGHQQR